MSVFSYIRELHTYICVAIPFLFSTRTVANILRTAIATTNGMQVRKAAGSKVAVVLAVVAGAGSSGGVDGGGGGGAGGRGGRQRRRRRCRCGCPCRYQCRCRSCRFRSWRQWGRIGHSGCAHTPCCPCGSSVIGEAMPRIRAGQGPTPHSTPVPQGMSWNTIPRAGRKAGSADVAASGTAPWQQIRPPGAAW